MFEYLSKKDSYMIRNRLGHYVAHQVVNRWSDLVSVDELNQLSRLDLARTWFESQTKNNWWNEENYNRIIGESFENTLDFLEEIAIYIDSRIPGAYIKYRENLKQGVDSIKISYDKDMNLPYGLKYYYSQNLTLHAPSSMVGATDKQLKYLKNLSAKKDHGFSNFENMTKEEAMVCIDYFLNMDYKTEPECFLKYFRKAI